MLVNLLVIIIIICYSLNSYLLHIPYLWGIVLLSVYDYAGK
jgi:hypothetical protein